MSLGKDIAATAGAAALLALGGGAAGFAAYEVPEPVVVTQQAEAAQVEISDPANLLTEEDEARLLRDVERLDRPDTVKRIHFIMLDDGREKVNDTVQNFLRDHYPDEIGNDKFADGVVIVGADMKARKNFIYAGEDVADQMMLRSGQRLEPALEAMKPGLQNDNLEAALFAGANTALNVEDVEHSNDGWEEDRMGEAVALGVGACLLYTSPSPRDS